jgi:DnaJ-class molecular chaperone
VVTLDEVITPQTCRLIRGEGMPINIDSSDNLMKHLYTVDEMEKGDLYVKFDIRFPTKISNEHKIAIVKALRENEESA